MAEPTPKLPIARNTALLAGAFAVTSAMLQLAAAVATITFALVVDVEGLLGLGPALVLLAGAMAALPAGRAMDRFGRIPVLAAGFMIGILAGVLVALGVGIGSPIPVVVGRLRLEPHQVVLLELELGRVLHGDDPLRLRDESREHVQ